MKFLDRIFNFICDYEDVFKFCLIMFGSMCLSLYVAQKFDKNLTRDKSIIENTKKYSVYKNCKTFNNEFYCWND